MDIAAFVGFAASGPVNIPVPVEDAAQFAQIFGDDIALAYDPLTNEPEFAYLAPTVNAFFRNGGRRCWIVRVAGTGIRTNLFPIPGLLQVDPESGVATPAFAAARSPGSWSDALRVTATLLLRPITPLSLSPDPAGIAAELDRRTPVVVGDLVQINLGNYLVLFAVKSAALQPSVLASPPITQVVGVIGDKVTWFCKAPPASVGSGSATARLFINELASTDPPQLIQPDLDPPPIAVLDISYNDTGLTEVLLDPAAPVPDPGSFLRVDVGSEQLWLTVGDARLESSETSPPGGSQGAPAMSPPGAYVQVTGQGLWRVVSAPNPLPTFNSATDIAQVLNFDLWSKDGAAVPIQMQPLGFDERSLGFWGGLQSDAEAYDPDPSPDPGTTPPDYETLWAAAAAVNFPLAGNAPPGVLFVPIGMPVVGDSLLPNITPVADAPHRDGLDRFESSMFLDPDFNVIDASVLSLQAAADFIRYQAPDPRPLQGIHAVMALDEVTIIAVPDAVHRPWNLASANDILPPAASPSLVNPALWHLRPCDISKTPANVTSPPWQFFLNCDSRIVAPPVLNPPPAPDATGSFTLSWSASENDPVFHLQEATEADFSDAVELYVGSATQFAILGRRSPAVFYYRVRVIDHGTTSDWSNGVAVAINSTPAYALDESADQAPPLLDVHRALLRMCATRGDVLAVLSMPVNFSDSDAVDYVNALCGLSSGAAGPANVRPLGFGEVVALNYGAMYHPWLIVPQDPTSEILQTIPGDGAATGIIAGGAISRGAWIAPANVPANAVVDLTPAIPSTSWQALQNAGVNLFRLEAHGFVTMDADTLSDDPDVQPINVRRLLMLLRRVALQKGNDYVFEPNNDAFRRSVARGFRRVMDDLFVQGAFAGDTPATSYQVSTPATADDLDNGRLIVELRVAPSQPLSFMTVRLAQNGDAGLVVQEIS
jgi:hypothetical protein